MIKVFGYKVFDIDLIGLFIIWVWYLFEVCKEFVIVVLQGELNIEVVWMLIKWDLVKLQIIDDVVVGDKCVIVDINNLVELFVLLVEVEVIEIIDYYLLVGGIKMCLFINIIICLLVCIVMIMYDLIGFEDLVCVLCGIKGVMLICILLDMLEFCSFMIMLYDCFVVEMLVCDLGVLILVYVVEMFVVKLDVLVFDDVVLLCMDSKEYELGGK